MSTKTEVPGPLPEGFEPMSDRQIVKNRRVADAIGENNVRRYTWKRANKEQEARGWASTVTLTMESAVQHNNADMLAGFVNVAAEVLTYALDSLRFERARAEAAEAEIAALRAERDAAVARAEAAEAEVARWRSPHGEIDMLLPDVERVLLAAELGARLTPDIAADWMPRARSALAALRARDLGASAALEGAQRRYLEAEAEVAHLRAALRGDR